MRADKTNCRSLSEIGIPVPIFELILHPLILNEGLCKFKFDTTYLIAA